VYIWKASVERFSLPAEHLTFLNNNILRLECVIFFVFALYNDANNAYTGWAKLNETMLTDDIISHK